MLYGYSQVLVTLRDLSVLFIYYLLQRTDKRYFFVVLRVLSW